MSIYTELIEKTKKEIKEVEDGISNLDVFNLDVLDEKLETLQLAEKMHEEFVKELTDYTALAKDRNDGRKEAIAIQEVINEIEQKINRLNSHPTQARVALRCGVGSGTQTQKGEEKKK